MQLCIGSRTKVSKVFWVRSVGSVGFGVAWVGRVPGRLRADVVDVLLFGFWWVSGFGQTLLFILRGSDSPPVLVRCSSQVTRRLTWRVWGAICKRSGAPKTNFMFDLSSTSGAQRAKKKTMGNNTGAKHPTILDLFDLRSLPADRSCCLLPCPRADFVGTRGSEIGAHKSLC